MAMVDLGSIISIAFPVPAISRLAAAASLPLPLTS